MNKTDVKNMTIEQINAAVADSVLKLKNLKTAIELQGARNVTVIRNADSVRPTSFVHSKSRVSA